ncbi:YqeB family protein [Gordonia aichiensis]|uniref:Uncharacterized protein n=1 Tax=Gordonia aichiensis NBRC 108223 TaxID=1220583 RepID=L7KRA6_9ACTN|nr:hypothetical protein [Gordonia aichiensis]GAC50462.1 hypothetical protein GOACH_24_00830 [Gordonia aichiensis NBRC 108223]
MAESTIDVSISQRWVIGMSLAGAVLGCGAAFLVGPLVNWLLGLAGDAPGPLRLAAGLPLIWAIPILTLAGCFTGLWFGREWQKENGTITITVEGMTVHRAGSIRHVARERIGGAFTDGHDLVVTDTATNELLRVTTDRVLVDRLRGAFERLDYPWHGTRDPYDDAFAAWVDGSGLLDAHTHDLFRARERALADDLPGTAENARDELRDLGIAVRARGGGQQYRLARGSELG